MDLDNSKNCYYFIFFSSKGEVKMPGHIKKSDGPDPDPTPWLAVTEELKKKLLTKPYDAKKSCWVPDKATHGYFEGLIEQTEGEKVTVKLLETGEVSFIFNLKFNIY